MSQLKYKVYNVKNGGSQNTVYLGRASIQGFRQSNQTYFYWHFNKNVKDSFLFASVVGSKNVKVTAPSDTSPFIQFDTRFYNFYNTDTNPANFFSATAVNG